MAMILNKTNVCLNDTELVFAPVLRWLMPTLVIAGVLGNIMILIVLNSSKSMKTKPHLLLSAMAAADLAHSLVALIINLYLYEGMIDNDSFSRIYHHVLKTPFLMLANWMAMTSTWLAVAVTIERLIAIRYPLKARLVMRKSIIVATILLIALISFVVTSYYLFWLRPHVYPHCADPSRYFYRLTIDQRLLYYGHVSRNVHSFLCSLVPVILLFFFNGSLVYHLHRNQALMRKFHDTRRHSPPSQGEISDMASNGYQQSNNNAETNGQLHQATGVTIRREYKVAVVVLVISITSALCLLPSAALVVYDAGRFVANMNNSTPKWYFAAGDISNLLIVTEKVLDFFLYCLTSGYFRRRLILVLTSRRRSSSITKQALAVRPMLQKRLKWFGRRTKSIDDPSTHQSIVYNSLRYERRPSTSTLSTFFASAASRLRRSTTSSDGSQRSPRLLSPKQFLTVQHSDQNGEIMMTSQNL